MIWTILCAAAAGLSCILLLVGLPHARAQLRDHLSPPEVAHHVFVGVVLPLVFIIIMFKLYIWWLIVVFDFYNIIKFRRGGPAFEAVPMRGI
ncbi:hypothetical protein FJT64_022788 [Amphibalanus amphitrite]|uniref:Uncharacterized protein n=1 Tax=Amphibalanus amphitrite TaxID=1232801 RepID=A0A6A4WFU0_AMPAM|nr:hypothetical protein FJT64_022788 [Amphibalanus amphitrite]